jgi:TonB family protein
MKAFGLAAIATALLCQAANAAAIQSEDFWISPKFDLKKAQWPTDAAGKLLYGKATLDCAVGPTGYATDCVVKSEDPVSPALREAAPRLASLYSARKPTTGRASLDIELLFDVPPDWLNKPTADDFGLVYPRKAASLGISGRGTIKCVVNLQGLLQACSIVSESPPGRGFGAAAIALAPTFLMTPATRNGQPVESEVRIPVGFGTENGVANILPNELIIGAPAWSQTPSVTEILAQIDKKVGDKFADGKVIFQCRLNKVTGKLSECDLANASPGMSQFRDVANALVPKFQADQKTLTDIRARFDPTETDADVFLPFAFPDMASPGWGKRYITHVQWAHPYDPPPAGQPTLPEAAVKAGLKDGLATVDCQIGSEGALSGCDVISESTPGVGLGGLAKTIAEGWVANRWTEEGLPVDGARVRLPIKMIYGHRPYVDADPTLSTKP